MDFIHQALAQILLIVNLTFAFIAVSSGRRGKAPPP
jgi:hypothetical protein